MENDIDLYTVKTIYIVFYLLLMVIRNLMKHTVLRL